MLLFAFPSWVCSLYVLGDILVDDAHSLSIATINREEWSLFALFIANRKLYYSKGCRFGSEITVYIHTSSGSMPVQLRPNLGLVLADAMNAGFDGQRTPFRHGEIRVGTLR